MGSGCASGDSVVTVAPITQLSAVNLLFVHSSCHPCFFWVVIVLQLVLYLLVASQSEPAATDLALRVAEVMDGAAVTTLVQVR